MFNPGGFYLGEFNRREAYYHGEGSALIFTSTGAGKSTASSIQNLLRPHVDPQGRSESILALDIKGEMLCVAERRLRELGYRIVVIAPWWEKMGRELGRDLIDDKYNPTLPKMGGSSQYFLNGGREVLVWQLLRQAERNKPELMNLVETRRGVMASPDELDVALATSSESEAFNGALKEVANKLLQMKLSSGEEFSGVLSTASQSLKIFDAFGPLGEHVSATDGFSFTSMKDQPTAAFIVAPAERTLTHQTWLRMVMANAIEEIGRDRTNKRLLCLFDEFGNVYLPNIMKALTLYRSQGIRFALYTQTGTSQIRERYGDDGMKTLLGNMECIQCFGVRDRETLRMLSELAGNTTVKEFNQSLTPDLDDPAKLGFSTSASNQGRPLIRPEDIHRLPDGKQLVFLGNQQPYLMDKVSYRDRKHSLAWADPNPYYAR